MKEAALGGLLAGLGAALLLIVNGRIAGIAGILGGLVRPTRGDVGWRVAFLLGMVAGGVGLFLFRPAWFEAGITRSPAILVGSGLLVGIGARMSNGCTSGHGLCGVARFSPRSITATVLFMAVAAGMVLVVNHVLAGAL
jgi:uncharacterized membrane protein YedE/YeeE